MYENLLRHSPCSVCFDDYFFVARSRTRVPRPGGSRGCVRGCRVAADARYLTSVSSLNIGRYIEITMIPTMTPTRIIISGSMIDVIEAIAASTSSS